MPDDTTPQDLPDLGGWLRRHDGTGTLTLARDEVAAVVHEIKRLQQSADRLRKQNNKLRKRVARLKGGGEDLADAGDGDAAPDTRRTDTSGADGTGPDGAGPDGAGPDNP